MNKELLQKLISEGKTLRQISFDLSKSYTTIRHWIKKYEIQINRKRGPRNKSGLSKAKLTVVLQKERAVRRKLEFINELGGKCSCCGYNKNWSAIDFHHTDPSTKVISLDVTSLGHYSQETLNKEVKKCVLLCANCHREHHNSEKIL